VSSPNYAWHSLYLEALAETDISKKRERIRSAEDAIRGRRRELVGQGDHGEEVFAAEDALMRLTWVREIPRPRGKSA